MKAACSFSLLYPAPIVCCLGLGWPPGPHGLKMRASVSAIAAAQAQMLIKESPPMKATKMKLIKLKSLPKDL